MVALAGLAAGGCAMLPPLRSSPRSHLPEPQRLDLGQAQRHHRFALVLSGGSLRGLAHIGVLRVLEEAQLAPDLVVGTSAGSVVGALYAAGMTAEQMEQVSDEVGLELLTDWVMPRLGLLGGRKIEQWINRHIDDRLLETLAVRLLAVATDLRDGSIAVFDRGNTGRAVQASSSVPGLFEPAWIDGVPYVDGNLSSPVPIGVARLAGAERVAAVNVIYPPEEMVAWNPLQTLNKSLLIAIHGLARREAALADVLIEPKLPREDQITVGNRGALIAAGEEATRSALPALRQLVAGSPRRQQV